MMIVTGHRGAMGLMPENTLSSINKAIEHGVDEVEIDVRVTKDHVPILIHGAKLIDPSRAKFSVSGSDLALLKEHKPDLATLEQAIALVNARVGLVIEIKHKAEIKPIIALLQRVIASGYSPNKLVIASFSYRILKQIHQAMPNLVLAVNEQWTGVRAQSRADKLKTKRIQMQERWLWSGFIKLITHHGYQLFAYVVNDPSHAKKLVSYGLAGIITDYPDRFSS